MPSTRLYLRGLPNFVGKDEVTRYLSSYGKIVDVKILNGYGFVQFDLQKDATDVLEIFTHQPFLGAKITVEYARLRNESFDSGSSTSPTRPRLAPAHAQLRYPVVVTNLPPRICWQELKDFGRLAGGLVAFCDIDRSRRGRGFIEYLSQEDADHAVKKLNGKDLEGNIVKVCPHDINSRPGASRSRSRSPISRRQEQPLNIQRCNPSIPDYGSRTTPVKEGPRSRADVERHARERAYGHSSDDYAVRTYYEREWEQSRRDWYAHRNPRWEHM